MKKLTNRSYFKQNIRRGFTLIEIVLAVAILSLLAVIIIPNFFGYINGAKKSSDEVSLSSLNNATALYAANEGKSTTEVFADASTDSLKISTLVTKGYLSSATDPHQADKLFSFDSGTGIWTLSAYNGISENPTDNLLYQSDFSSMANIKVLKGAWQVLDGILSPAKSGEDRAILPGTSGTDYDIQMSATLTSAKPGSSGYGIYYRATESADISGYCFQYDPGAGNRFVVKKVTNGKEATSFQMVSMSKVMGSGFDMAASHNIEISVTGDNHIITVDGIKVMDFNDSTFTSGSVGVRSWDDSKVQISDINVTAN